MAGYQRKSRPRQSIQFNVTPLLDVVLLLVIFFMLVCDFIRRESFQMTIPDNCPQARTADPSHVDALTVSIFPASAESRSAQANSQTIADSIPESLGSELPGSDGPAADIPVVYAVRDVQFDPYREPYRDDPERLIKDVADQIKRQIGSQKGGMVHLRADRDVPYGRVQASLIALSRAGVQKIQLAAQRSGK